jgi:D-threo-aldose 1-dehydrogenase
MNDDSLPKIQLPRLGFGASGIAGLYQSISPAQADAVLEAAWDAGLRFFDTAPHYGQGLSERRLGDFLRSQQEGSFILSTKVGRLLHPSRGRHDRLNDFCQPLPFDQVYDYTHDGVMRSFEDSLQRLGHNRVDILLVHEIGRLRHGPAHEARLRDLLDGGWKALDRLRSEGCVRAIGLGVNEVDICLDLLPRVDLDLVLVAGCLTLLDQSAETDLLPACSSRGVQYVAAGVFNSGILATGPEPHAHFDYGDVPEAIALRVSALQRAFALQGIELPHAALQYPLRDDRVASVLIGTASVRELRQNISWAQQPLQGTSLSVLDEP